MRLILVKVIAMLALIPAAFFLLAPTRLGGRTAYVVVTGNSMEPYLHRGDLAILRQTADYQVGDVVTYRHPSIGRVIHRIIHRNGERFILQGDNNSWMDAYQPVIADIEGELVLHLPRAGSAIWGFRTPVGAALLAGVLGIFLLWPGSEEQECQPEEA